MADLDPAQPYPSVADVGTYFTAMRPAAGWADLTPEAQAAAHASATLQFDLLCWHGAKVDPAQPHAWPRTAEDICCGQNLDGTEIPVAIGAAFCELCLALGLVPTLLLGGKAETLPPGLYVSEQELEGLRRSFAAFPAGSSGSRYSARAPLLFQKLPWMGQLLECWVDGSYGSARILSRC